MWQYNNPNILMHHGIKGMKWGVRRYQYKDGTLTPAGKARYSDGSGRRSSGGNDGTKSIHNLMKKPVSSLKNDIVGMDEAMVELMAYIAVPVAIAIHATVKNRKFIQQKLNTLEEMKDNREFKTIKDVPKLSKKETPDLSMKQTNPNYPKSGYTMNCALCTTAMALRQKGYNVSAKASDTGWPAKELFQKAFNSESHTMKYGQSGEEYDVSDPSHSDFLNSINLNSVTYNRLDDCQPTEYALALITKG